MEPRRHFAAREVTLERATANEQPSQDGASSSSGAGGFAALRTVQSRGMADRKLSLRTCDEVLAFLRDYEPRDEAIEELEGTIRLQRNLAAVAEQAEREADGPPPAA